jgi:hypothetical protein
MWLKIGLNNKSRGIFFCIEAVSRLFLPDVWDEHIGNIKSHTDT